MPSAIQNALEKYRLEIEKQSHLFELIKNERHYRALIENGADVLVVLTAEGKPKYVSPSIQHVLGYTEDEALQLNLFETLHPDDFEPATSKLADCITKPGVPIQGYEGRIKNKNGEWVWLEATLTNMLHDPTINGIISNFRNITERRLASASLIKSQLFNKTLLSSLDAHIAVINSYGTIIAVNKAWEDFAIENTSDTILLASEGNNYFEVCEKAAADGDKIAEQTLKGVRAVFLKDVESFKIEYPCHSATERRWFVMNATRFEGDDANIVISHQNITDRKLAEEKAFLSELMFRGLIENSSDGMAILTANGKPKYVSPSIKNVLGYTEKEGMGLDLVGLAHPDDVPLLLSLMQEVIANPGMSIKGGATRVRHKDQSWRWVEGVITNMLHDPAINGIVGNFRDVTERIMAEQAIKDSESKYRSFFENSMDGILLTVTDGEIFAANPAACAIFQMTEEEICQKGRFGLVDNDDPRLAIAIKKRQQTGAAKTEITLVRKDGSKFPGEITSAVFADNSGLQRTSMIVRDISEQKLAEAKVLHANRLYVFISQINQTIVHVKDGQTLFDEACRIAVEIGKFKMAWIGVPQTEGRISLVASHGSTPAQLEFFSEYPYEPGGPIDRVLRGQNYVAVANIRAEVKTMLSEVAGKAGFNSVIVLPIKNGERLVATFNIYSTELDFFNTQEIALLTEAAADISFALGVLEKEKLRLLGEQQLLISEKKLIKAQTIAKLGYWELNLSNNTLFWSDETFRIWGRDKDAFVPTLESLIDTVHANDRQLFISQQAVSSVGTTKLDIEYRIVMPDNSIKWVNDKGSL
ncbi:PAS domain S-box protein [Mucilaginibacter antarcticus]|uniref:PAS domain S-box protein n=1 Tax=Mucilaginibacter antarcticus TaxID=1855725 RepID=UPI00362CBADE